ncbi:MAG: methylmalonyl Co-A mutase-associated GTPase MeaB [Pseudomonadota bacterium]
MADGAAARTDALARRVRAGDQAALARALTRAENGDQALMQALRSAAGGATVVGVTGAPGAGKSTLLNAMIRDWRRTGQRVALLAVDPVSPLTGGAVLGDRTRMGEHSGDPGVFIRSLSARGHLGGLSATTLDMVDVMDAAGWDLILLETVGAGQSETEIAGLADIKIVVCAPGLGDEVQAIKAGILEIADILVVNKSDRPEADRTARDLASMVELRRDDLARKVPVLRSSATSSEGVAELRQEIDRLAACPSIDRKHRRLLALRSMLADRLAARLQTSVMENSQIEDVLEDLAAGRTDLDQALADTLAILLA